MGSIKPVLRKPMMKLNIILTIQFRVNRSLIVTDGFVIQSDTQGYVLLTAVSGKPFQHVKFLQRERRNTAAC